MTQQEILNPNLAELGAESAARQYPGRAVGADWTGPFHREKAGNPVAPPDRTVPTNADVVHGETAASASARHPASPRGRDGEDRQPKSLPSASGSS
jgi:hypothetical protein